MTPKIRINSGEIQTQLKVTRGGESGLQLKTLNHDPLFKPNGGCWSSTFLTCGEYASDWVRWCMEEELPGWLDGERILFDVPKGTRYYMVDTYQDLEELYKAYPLLDSRFMIMHYLDWLTIAKAVDAIWLTEEGQWRTRLSHPLNLYGWDTESICFFKPVWENVRFYTGELVRKQAQLALPLHVEVKA